MLNVNYLSILGVIFDNKFNFKHHLISLKKSLAARTNIALQIKIVAFILIQLLEL